MKKALGLLCAVLVLSGCASYQPYGVYSTSGKMGLQDNGGPTIRTGKACMKSILSLAASGDASIEAAKANGNISRVSTIDYEVDNLLGIYGTYCTVVKGE
jgi:hypothetical protein